MLLQVTFGSQQESFTFVLGDREGALWGRQAEISSPWLGLCLKTWGSYPEPVYLWFSGKSRRVGRNQHKSTTTCRNNCVVTMSPLGGQVSETSCPGSLLALALCCSGVPSCAPPSVFPAKPRLEPCHQVGELAPLHPSRVGPMVPASPSPPVSCRSSVLPVCRNREPEGSLL